MFQRLPKRLIFIFGCNLITLLSSVLGMLFLDAISITRFFNQYPLILVSDCAVMTLLVLWTGLDQSSFKNAGISECKKIFVISLTLLLLNLVQALQEPSVLIRWTLLHFFFFAATLFFAVCSKRLLRHLMNYSVAKKAKDNSSVIIVGAGEAGAALVHSILSGGRSKMYPVCFVDDSPAKQNTYIHGVKVEGTIADLPELCEKYSPQRIVVAIPSVHPSRTKEILAVCQSTGRKIVMLPNHSYMINNGSIDVASLRDIDENDLLGRDPIQVDLDEINSEIQGKTVLVTGAGGSIGSELCRQLAGYSPSRLIVFDIYENSAYDLEQELKRSFPGLALSVFIGSVRDKTKIDWLFREFRPQIVFNAAAHKHVPLMEASPNEAVKNNVFGTLNVALAAERYQTEKFIQISTDKAVNPTNIMGATKRIGEMIIQTIGKRSLKTKFVAVRFGNVLGSNGSVVPLFKKQIREGGPVTVTHKDIIRYFMTIPEAVSLVLQACCYANAGEIFVFDMGDPVRIYDLAENLIRLSGLTPGKDIEIVCTGLRPGEKLFEERLMEEEGLQKTANDKISIGKPLEMDEENLFSQLQELEEAAESESEDMKRLVAKLVTTYQITEN